MNANYRTDFKQTAIITKCVRLWEDDPELYLNASVALVPLAPLTNVNRSDLPSVVQRMKERIGREPRSSCR